MILTDTFPGSGDIDAAIWDQTPTPFAYNGTTGVGLQESGGACVVTAPSVNTVPTYGEALGIQNPASADYYVSAHCNMPYSSASNSTSGVGGTYIYLYARARHSGGSDHGYYVVLDAINTGGNNITVYADCMSAFIGTTPADVNVADPTDFVVRLEAEGTAIRVLVNGVQVISFTNSTETAAGNAGFALSNNRAAGVNTAYSVLSIEADVIAPPAGSTGGVGTGSLTKVTGRAKDAAVHGALTTIGGGSTDGRIHGTLNATLPSGPTLQGFGSTAERSGLRAALPMLTGRAYGSGDARGVLPLLTLSGHGIVTSLGRLTKTLPQLTIVGSGTAPRIARLTKTLPVRMTLRGAGGGRLTRGLPLLTLSASGTSYSVGRLIKSLPRPAHALVGYGGGRAKKTLPKLTLSAAGTSYSVGRLTKKLPRPMTLAGYGAGALSTSLPVLRISGAGTAPSIGRLVADLPGSYSMAGYGGGYASPTLPLLRLTGVATAWIVGRLSAALPGLTFSGSVTMPVVGKLSASLPALRMVSPGQLRAYLPQLTLSASGHIVLSTEYEAYSITLIELENGQTGVAVTRYTDYPFDQIVRWRGKYYGVATDGLYELAGDTFDGDPIVSVIETMETDFDSPEFKRTPALYLQGRVGADFNVAVLSSEVESNTYPTYRPISKPGANTHRCVFGKGIRAHYLGYRLSNVNGEDFTIDTFTPDVAVLKRRI